MGPSSEVIKDAIMQYGELVSGFRAQLKENSTKTQTASANPAELVQLQKSRADQLEALYQVISTANELGHPHIVENLGENQKLVLGLTTTLIECSKIKDYAGKLPNAIFTFLTKLKTLTEELLKKLKFEKICAAYTKNNNSEQLKKAIAFILSNTVDARAKAEKSKQDAVKVEEQKKTLETIEKNKARKSEAPKAGIPSTKRPHEGDVNGSKPNKKFASDTGAAVPSAKPIPKRPTSNLLGITSKPITKPAPKPAPKKRESPPPVSKLGAILDSINEAPKPPKAPVAPDRPPETAEEKKRRERKESRRHLRVKFKEGADLEEVREFTHEKAEDEGRQGDMLRDAHDDRSEGMMHKKRVSEKLDTAMEDDESSTLEDGNFPPNSLVQVDLSNIPKSTKHGPSYVTRGGDKPFTTPDQEIQKQREQLELLAVYTNPSDIPKTPKEPGQADDDSGRLIRDLVRPSEPWVAQRLQELQTYGPEHAFRLFASRIQAQQSANSAPSPSTTIDSLLQGNSGASSNIHTSPQHQSQNLIKQAKYQAMEQDAFHNLMRIVDSLKGKPYPPTEPPAHMTDPLQKAEWWAGFNRDKAIKDAQVAAQLAAQKAQQAQQAQKAQQAQMIQHAQMVAAQFQPPPMVPQQPAPPMQSQVPYPIPPPPPPQSFPHLQPSRAQPNAASSLMSEDDVTAQVQAYLAGAGMSQPSHQQYNNNKGWSGDKGRNDGYDNDQGYEDNGKWSKNKGKRGHEKKTWGNWDGPLDENGQYKGKKRPCVFFQQGKCAKGDKCTFLHET